MVPVARRGFTLFEIALSVAILGGFVVVAAALLPTAIATQTRARFELYASAKAVEMVDTFASSHNLQFMIDAEAFAPWDVPSGYSAFQHDLERRVCGQRSGIFPVPTIIARRLDSDGDAIARILDDGGALYYSQPQATTGLKEDAVPMAAPNEAQRLVFAVDGCAQQNAITIFPWKAWPYSTPWPSPPGYGAHRDEPGFSLEAGTLQLGDGFLWEHASDPDIAAVARLVEGVETYGFAPYLAALDEPSAVRYCQAALWYCAAKGVGAALIDRTTALTDFDPAIEPWRQVQALRFLAHAAACLTRYHPAATLAGAGVMIPPLSHAGPTITATSSPLLLTEAKITALHDSSLNLATLFAARWPYDWSVPRPTNRMIMLDHPLLQWDLFPSAALAPLGGTIFGSTKTASQWRAVAGQPITGLGRSYQYPTRPIGDIWGDPAHFSLAAPFAASERARALVFWSVDWQRFADVETAPSAAIDASRAPLAGPIRGADHQRLLDGTLLRYADWRQFSFRNPEKALCFIEPVAALPTGADVAALRVGSMFNGSIGGDDDRGSTPAARSVFVGRWGADRDADGVLDRGPLPPSVRLRATTVGGFVFYDPRVPLTVR
ncbi:MAG TPA: hypothetical protein VEL07_00730 [Planctomycetota bacterium]|nr:hypothetical protein [Planctomycetota bacterium]